MPKRFQSLFINTLEYCEYRCLITQLKLGKNLNWQWCLSKTFIWKKSSYKNARFWVSANVKSSKAMMSRLAIFLFPGARRRQEEEMWAKKPLPTLPIAFCAPFSRHPDNGRSGILVILSKVTHQEFSFLLLQDSIESLTTFLFLALREFLAVKWFLLKDCFFPHQKDAISNCWPYLLKTSNKVEKGKVLSRR